MKKELEGRTALITGASSGLGVDFARELAARGADCILVARREEKLAAVREELQSKFGIKAEIIPLDLLSEGAPAKLYEAISEKGWQVDILINNAGYGMYGTFLELPLQRQKDMLRLNTVVLTELSHLFMNDMVARNFGYVLQVSSIGGFLPSPTYAAYSATKSYVLNFSEAINYELRNTNVSSTVVCPGVTRTEFLEVAGQKPSLYQRMVMMESEDVARIGIKAMLKRRGSLLTGFLNTLSVFFLRFMPRRWMAAAGYAMMKID